MKKLLLICLAFVSLLAFFYSCDEMGKSSDAEILSFKVDTSEGTISGATVAITLPYGTDVTKLSPVIIACAFSFSAILLAIFNINLLQNIQVSFLPISLLMISSRIFP